MDQLDQAQALSERALARGVADVQARSTRPDHETCADCGERIEAARRAAAPFATRCIDCQHAAEREGGADVDR